MSGKDISVFAFEHVRRMRGGAQSHLLRCSDGEYYVVKFQNNPQGKRILANEMLASILAKRLGLPVPEAAIVVVDAEFVRYTEDLVIQHERSRVPCQHGLCFGSRYPRDPAEVQDRLPTVYDFLPEGLLRTITNMSDFLGMLLFDKWTGNTDDRQTVFFRNEGQFRYTALMIDHGYCFNGQEWNFLDVPRRGVCSWPSVYEGIQGIEAFDSWIERLDQEMNDSVLRSAFDAIPPAWYEHDERSFLRLLEELHSRLGRVRDLLCATAIGLPKFFPNWVYKASGREMRAASS